MDLYPRQQGNDDDIPSGWVRDDDGVARPWWYSKTGYIVKWCIAGGLILLVALYFIIAYVHAKRRLRKGLPPPRHHYWMVGRDELARVDPHYGYPQPNFTPYYGAPPPAYGMEPMAPPPVYQSKVDPAQGQRHFSQGLQGFQPPPGPPPGRAE